jgi:hypothetical protein
MIVVHSTEVSTLYPRVVILSLAKRLKKPPFAILTLPFVCDPEITTCRYKGLLQEYVMLCYGFPHAVTKAYYRSMSCFATDSHTKWPRLQCCGFPYKVAPFAPCGSESSQRRSQRWVTQTGAIPTQSSTTRCL